jgi:pimeloyl-ACP methyl ester carboxylesterase
VELAMRRLSAARETAGRPAHRLIAFHGGPGLDHHVLLPLGVRLAERFEVWLPDLPGHGGSVAPSGKLPGLPAVERGLASWLRGVGEPEGFLVGHSLGAWLLTRLLRRGKISPRALVLLSPPAAGQERGSTALRRAVQAMGGRGSARTGARPGAASERARRELRAHVEAETRGEASELFLRAVERVDVRDPRLYAALLRNFHRAVTGPVRPFAPGCPVLVLSGEEDLTTPPGQARTVAGSITGARLELLPGAGHYPFAERPEETARAILEFLEPIAESPELRSRTV